MVKNDILAVTGVLLMTLIAGCTKEKTDKELLNQDRKTLEEELVSFKVTPYKFGKIAIRSSVETDTISEEFHEVQASMKKIADRAIHYDEISLNASSLSDYLTMYRDYKSVEHFVKETDEDIFPTLTDVFNTVYPDSNSTDWVRLKGQEKIETQNIEHALLSVLSLGTKSLGKEVALYECSKTQPDLLPDSETKTLLQLLRGLLFMDKKLYYLSEDELSRNIQWLNHHQDIDLPITRAVFRWGNLSNQETHIALHGFNHMLRGIDRLMMDREVDQKRAIEDLEVFLSDAKKIGLDNEVTWAVEAFIFTEKEEPQKAIDALTRLKDSPLLSNKERKAIEAYITYLETRDPDSKLNKVYDKYFVGKIATKYIISVVRDVDWNHVFNEHNMEQASSLLGMINRLEEITSNFNTLTTTDAIKEEGKKLENKGLELWEKAKENL